MTGACEGEALSTLIAPLSTVLLQFAQPATPPL